MHLTDEGRGVPTVPRENRVTAFRKQAVFPGKGELGYGNVLKDE